MYIILLYRPYYIIITYKHLQWCKYTNHPALQIILTLVLGNKLLNCKELGRQWSYNFVNGRKKCKT